MNWFRLFRKAKKSLIKDFLTCPDDFDISIKTYGRAIVITLVEKEK